MRKKVYNKKGDKVTTLSQPDYNAKEGDCPPFSLPANMLTDMFNWILLEIFSSFFLNNFNLT